MTPDELAAREIVTELHDWGFGGDQQPETLENMRTLTKRIATYGAARFAAGVRAGRKESARWRAAIEELLASIPADDDSAYECGRRQGLLDALADRATP